MLKKYNYYFIFTIKILDCTFLDCSVPSIFKRGLGWVINRHFIAKMYPFKVHLHVNGLMLVLTPSTYFILSNTLFYERNFEDNRIKFLLNLCTQPSLAYRVYSMNKSQFTYNNSIQKKTAILAVLKSKNFN